MTSPTPKRRDTYASALADADGGVSTRATILVMLSLGLVELPTYMRLVVGVPSCFIVMLSAFASVMDFLRWRERRRVEREV